MLKEVTVVTNNIQMQVKDHQQTIGEQTTNNLTQIKGQLEDLENQSEISDRKIKELDTGNQNLLEKVLGMDTDLNEKLEKQALTDNSLLEKINDQVRTNHSIMNKSISSLSDTTGRLTEETENYQRRVSMLEQNELIVNSEIKNLSDSNSRNVQHIQAFEVLHDKVNNMEDNQNRSEVKLKSELKENITHSCESLKTFFMTTLNEKEGLLSQRIVYLEDDNKDSAIKLISLQEELMIQAQKASFIEALTTKVNKMDEIRQQSEATSKKEVEDRAAQNTSEINELRRSHEIALAELEKYIKQVCH
jgi:hypothetical protein